MSSGELTTSRQNDLESPSPEKAGGLELVQSSVELDPGAEARIAEHGHLIETKSPMSSGELTTARQNDLESPSLEVEFALVIARMIDSIERSPQDARNLIYDLARYKLGEQLLQAKPEERTHPQRALEVAIRNVEIFLEKQAHVVPAAHQSQLNGPEGVSSDQQAISCS